MGIKDKIKSGRRNLIQIIFGRTMIIILLLAVQLLLLFLLMFSAEKFIPYVFGSVPVFTAVMLVFILNTRENPTVKLSWCALIAVLPVFGALLYLFIRADLGHRVEQRAVQNAIDESAGLLASDESAYVRLKAGDKGVYNLSRYLQVQGGFPLYKDAGTKYFPVGEDKLKEMLVQLKSAEKFIFIEYFIIKNDSMWQEMLEILIEKAQAGVEVRVMYDGTNAITNLPYSYPEYLKKNNISCKMFSPLRPFVSTHYNNRDHRKILIVDGRVAFTGGINLADEYINRTHPYGHWKDTAVMVTGAAVDSFTLMFLQLWNANEKHREYKKYLKAHSAGEAEGFIIPYGDNPMDNEKLAEMVYLDIINRAKDYIYIMTPYLILDGETETALCFAAKRGVDVRIILPRVPDHIYAYVLAEDHYPALIAAGVKIYTYTPGFIHAKVFLSDENTACVGTVNLDYRSLYHHFECGALMYGVSCIADIKKDFYDTFKKSYLLTEADLKKRGMLSRLGGFLLKAAAPLM